jgi:hypothetical protein
MSHMSQDHATPPWPSHAWRFCASCWGVCHWHNVIKAWRCHDCGGMWFPDDDPQRYGAPEKGSA